MYGLSRDSEQSIAVDSEVKGVGSVDQVPLGEIGPMRLDYGNSRDVPGLWIDRCVISRIDAEELAVRLESAGFDVGKVVGEHFERFHAGPHAAGCRS